MPLPGIDKNLAQEQPQQFMEQLAGRAVAATQEALTRHDAKVATRIAAVQANEALDDTQKAEEIEGIIATNQFGLDDRKNALQSAFADLKPLTPAAEQNIQNFCQDLFVITDRVTREVTAAQSKINPPKDDSSAEQERYSRDLEGLSELAIVKAAGALDSTREAINVLLPDAKVGAAYDAAEKNLAAPPARSTVIALDRALTTQGVTQQHVFTNMYPQQSVSSWAANGLYSAASAAYKFADAVVKEINPQLKDDHHQGPKSPGK